MTIKERYSIMIPSIQNAVKPFIEEFRTLSRGEECRINARLDYGGKNITLSPTVFLIWRRGTKCEIEDLYDYLSNLDRLIVEESPEVEDFNFRITKFLSDLEKVSLSLDSSKTYLWDEFFAFITTLDESRPEQTKFIEDLAQFNNHYQDIGAIMKGSMGEYKRGWYTAMNDVCLRAREVLGK